MSKLLDAAKRPRVLIPTLLVVVLIGVFAAVSLGGDRAKTESQKPTDKGLATLKKKDQEKVDRMYDMINLIVGTYTDARVTYPTGDKAGWADIVENVPQTTSFTDPYTDSFYAFTMGDPDFGQISYKPGSDCDTKTQEYKPGTFRSIALRAKLYSGYRCVSSVEVQAHQSKDVR